MIAMTPPPDGECLVVNPAQWPSVENMKEDDEINIAIVERISRLQLVDNNNCNKQMWHSAEILDGGKNSSDGSDSPSDLGSSLSVSDPSSTSISKEVFSSGLDDSGINVVKKNDQQQQQQQQSPPHHNHHNCRCTCSAKKTTQSGHNCVKSLSDQKPTAQANNNTNGNKTSSSCQPKNGSNYGKWVSPAEFFQATRQRSSALANKVSTTSTFSGSREHVTQDLLRVSAGKDDKDKKSIEQITKALEQATLNGGKQPPKNVDELKSAELVVEKSKDDSELVQRSPIPVLQNNRHLVQPYQTQKPSHCQIQPLQRCNDYNYVKTEQQQQCSPLQYIQQQRQRACASQGGQMKGYPPLQQNAYNLQQQQSMYPSCYQQQEHNQQMYDEFGNNGCCYQEQQQPLQQQQPIMPLENCYMTIFQQQQQIHNVQQQQQPVQNQNNPYSPCVMSPANQYSPCSVRSEEVVFYKNSAQQIGSPALMGGNSNNATPIQSPYNPAGLVCVPTGNAETPLTPFTDEHLTNDELNRLLNNNQFAELPEALSDFILKYSRRYSVGSGDQPLLRPSADSDIIEVKSIISGTDESSNQNSSRKGSTSSDEGYQGLSSVENHDDQSSVCESPFSVGSTPGYSPAAPQGGQTPGTPTKKQPLETKKDLTPNSLRKLKPKPVAGGGVARIGRAKQKLREMISNEEFDNAWAWAVRCSQACPGALFYRDPDGDSLLHIVVWHKDLSKIYALTELMTREDTQSRLKPFDLPNKLDETPLFLAVEKRMEEVVAYALENAANPNHRTRNRDGDAALHYAASRGMTEIVQALCASPLTNLNLLNGAGLTPLLCAVKNHGVIEEESQCLVNNKPTIRILLKAGADPKIPDASTGKTVLHYSVERMDPDLVQLFRDHLDKESMSTLVNMPSYTGETALHILGRMASPRGSSYSRGEGEEELRRKMFMTLVDCGADITLCESPDPLDAQFTILDPSLSP